MYKKKFAPGNHYSLAFNELASNEMGVIAMDGNMVVASGCLAKSQVRKLLNDAFDLVVENEDGKTDFAVTYSRYEELTGEFSRLEDEYIIENKLVDIRKENRYTVSVSNDFYIQRFDKEDNCQALNWASETLWSLSSAKLTELEFTPKVFSTYSEAKKFVNRKLINYVYGNAHNPQANTVNSVAINDLISGEVYFLSIVAHPIRYVFLNEYTFSVHEEESMKTTRKTMGKDFK